ncbi:uncharacterized protein LOC121236574 [Juglans microcarpa x Juglans regia]|uniref:uncharacterized protein LOC121236574 n=1 Tax=Juglans microcarpa x Juglans regia TaxID=2249226 RepID=UPI001B7E4E62|nr:uncharacterized protein LOC121236574 [Juglans microcarpa x Juglans regia]
MKLISWNAHGLGNPRGVRALHDLIMMEVPTVVFLLETKLAATAIERITVRVGLDGCFVVPCEGRSGGLALMWKNEMSLCIKSYSLFHIDAKLEDPSKGILWKFTRVYGNPITERRRETWELIRHLKEPQDIPWLVCGDFNEVLCIDEKLGGRQRQERLMNAFRKVLNDCHLFDLGFQGLKYTWSSTRQNQQVISERLDRFVANMKWMECFPQSRVYHCSAAYSDHLPISLSLSDGLARRRSKLFRFEAMWIEEDECEEVISRHWQEAAGGNNLMAISKKIKACSRGLEVWNEKKFGKSAIESEESTSYSS